MKEQKLKIVILGAGFAGLSSALSLNKKLRGKNLRSRVEITLIDENNRHIYTPDLYEIATAYNAKITPECLIALRDTVATPLSTILSAAPNGGPNGALVKFMRDRVMQIHESKQTISLMKNADKPFDYLVIALGSSINYYDIPGLDEYAFPFKNVTHALAINCHVDTFFQKLWQRHEKKPVSIIVGGGGATGSELAAELPSWIKKICEKYSYPRPLVKIHLVEAGPTLGGKNEKASLRIAKRLSYLGIDLHLESAIRNVTETSVRIEKEDKEVQNLPMDILLWAGGVKPVALIKANFADTAPNGALKVNAHLQYEKNSHIYAAGDNAYIIRADTQKPVPLLAQAAFDQGRVIAENLFIDIEADVCGVQKKPYVAYRGKIKGVITPLGGKFAIFSKGKFATGGFLIWVLRRLVDLRYAISILPAWPAIKKWLHDTNVFVKND